MMSALGEAGGGQRPKKKLVAYGKAGAKARPPAAAQATTPPVKDIYDYDFVDEEPRAVTSMATPRPLPTAARPAAASGKGAGTAAGSRSAATAKLAASPMAAPVATAPKPTPMAQRSAAAASARAAGETVLGLKRKPPPGAAAPTLQTGAGAGTAAGATSAHAKKIQHASRNTSAAAVSLSSPLLQRQSRTTGTAATKSPQRPRALQTPPRETADISGSPKTPRMTAASPRKAKAAPTSTAAKDSSRKPPPQAETPHRAPVAFRSRDSLPPGNTADTASSQRLQQQRNLAAARSPTARPAARPASAAQGPKQRKRRRLIDTLAAQEEVEEDEEEEEGKTDEGGMPHEEPRAVEDDDASSDTDTILSRYRSLHSTPRIEDRGAFMDLDSVVTASPGKASLAAPSTPGTITRRAVTRRPGVKFTYNLERTMLAEEPLALGGPQGSNDLALLESLLPAPEPAPRAGLDLDDAANGGPAGAIQSIHELRQAGANSRFADELVDIMDRVGQPTTGKPSSARRSALLEMVQKLQEKSFLRHFRDQGAEMRLFRQVGGETDVVAGYALVSIVMTLLASGSASRGLLREFREQKIRGLFTKQLAADADIETVAKDRKSNVSAHMRQQVAGVKKTVAKLPVWKPAAAAPSQLSPRTLTLKALHLYAQQLQAAAGGVSGLGEDDGALSALLTKLLFGVVDAALSPAPADDDDDDGDDDEDDGDADGGSTPPLLSSGLQGDVAESVDVFLALSLLEMHSVSAMQSDISAEWTQRYLPILARALEGALAHHQTHSQRFNDLELLVLKLAMNTANNNPDAARYYVDKGLLLRLAEVSAAALTAVADAAKAGGDVAPDALNELLLMLGVMINFSENDPAAGETLAQGGGLSVFDQLGKTFLDGRAMAAEADSEEKSQLNVAFAYLSILLGYLCLHEPVYEAFARLSPSGNLAPLLASIRQFIVLHDQIGGPESSEHYTARLRALAQELDARA